MKKRRMGTIMAVHKSIESSIVLLAAERERITHELRALTTALTVLENPNGNHKKPKQTPAKKKRRKHSDAFKAKVVRVAQEKGVTDAARKYDVVRSLVDKWVALATNKKAA